MLCQTLAHTHPYSIQYLAPLQDTYVVFGAADTDHSGGEVSARPARGYTPATATAGISLDVS